MLSKELVQLFKKDKAKIILSLSNGSQLGTNATGHTFSYVRYNGVEVVQWLTCAGVVAFELSDFNQYLKNEHLYNSSLYKFLEGIDNDEET